MREQFEKLPEIAEKLKQHGIWYNEQINQYTVVMFKHNQERMEAIIFIGGAWYAFQEQQKKIDSVLHYLSCATNPLDVEVADIQELLK